MVIGFGALLLCSVVRGDQKNPHGSNEVGDVGCTLIGRPNVVDKEADKLDLLYCEASDLWPEKRSVAESGSGVWQWCPVCHLDWQRDYFGEMYKVLIRGAAWVSTVAREWKPVGELTLAGGDQLHPENLLLKQETHGSTSERHVVQDVLDLFCGSSVNISSDRSWLVGRQFLYSVQHAFCAGIYRVLNMSSSFDLGYVYIYVQNVTSRASDIFEQAKLWGVQLVDVFVHEYNDHVLGVGRWLVETTDNIGASIGRLIQILLNWAGVERNPGPDGPRRGRGG
jgi:hypothetical protein